MSFSSIIGHERQINILKRALANRTLAHAYLFSGETGVGKKMTALSLAAAVNCANPGPDGGCGSCPSCWKIAGQGHPDVHVVAADGEEIKIDRIRQIQGDLALKPFEGQKKILIVDGAENMNAASANAFLKTLEEPPGDALIVLITSMPQGLLDTIRSRCQEIRFLPLPPHALAEALISGHGISEDDALFLAALSHGSMGRALEMDIGQEQAAREEISSIWARLAGMNPAEILAQADTLSRDREGLERFLSIGIEWLRDALVFQQTGDEKLLVLRQGKDRYREWAEQFSLTRMLAEIDLFDASRRLLDRRVSGQLVAENLLLKLARG